MDVTQVYQKAKYYSDDEQVPFNYIKNKVINNRPMPIYKTSCNVYPSILGNPLTKPQNNINRQW
jgi:hypothetical protein